MKKINLILLLLFLLISFDVSAQKKGNVRKLFIEAQFNEIVSNLKLDENKTAKLRPIYFQYLADLRRSNAAMHKKITPDLSNEEIDKVMTAKFAKMREKVITREKYYKLFKNILTPKQILILYETEKTVMRKMQHEHMKRKKMSH